MISSKRHRRGESAGRHTVRASGTVRHSHAPDSLPVINVAGLPLRYAEVRSIRSAGSSRPEPGLNVDMLHQPIPSLFGWRVEASAEVRNLLAQGYLPLTMANGQQLLLVNTPRTFRGGLAFVF